MKDRITAELEQIAKTNKGLLKAEAVVDFARDPSTALHSQFTWDDTEAARQYRLWQARQVIRVNVSVLPSVDRRFRTFVSLVSDRAEPGGGYRPTANVMSNQQHREELLAQALGELELWQQKYNDLVELAGVFDAIKTTKRGRGKRKGA